MATIGITGGTGFAGKRLAEKLVQNGHKVFVFTRNTAAAEPLTGVEYTQWNPDDNEIDINVLLQLTAIIHLAGEGIADKRWTKKRKEQIVNSRVEGTAFLVSMLKQNAPNCKTFISASAIGYYGPDKGGQPFTETDKPYDDFLGNTVKQWERASEPIAASMRRVVFRFGIILGKGGGAFPQFEKPTRTGFLPLLGGGRQIISWIHLDDLVNMLIFAVEHEQINGIYNAVAPAPVTQKLLMFTIRHQKGGLPLPIPVPAFMLKIILGEMSIEVLKSTTVSSQKIENAGFVFKYPGIGAAVAQLLS